MKLSQLLRARDGLLQQLNLANLAFAYHVLAVFAARVTRGRLAGEITLKSADPASDRYWPSLIALDFNQSLIEEHFSDEDISELSDAIAYLSAAETVDLTCRIETLAPRYLGPLRTRLAQSGVDLALEESPRPTTSRG